MPCFGHVKFQEEAIASVVHQQYPPAEIIVVDDGSEDKCGPDPDPDPGLNPRTTATHPSH